MRRFELSRARRSRWAPAWLAALVVSSCCFQGCLGLDDDDSPAASDPLPRGPVASPGTNRGAPEELVHRCGWSTGKDAQESAIRNAFVDLESGEVRLLLADDTIRPGGILSVAVANDSSASVQYGTFSHIETEAGDPVRIKGPYGFPAIGLSASPHDVGPCVTLPVPSGTANGAYVAVVDDVRMADGTPTDLRAGFTVAGAPIPDPEWEVRLRKAALENRSRRQDRADQ
jgi:hypothetical protein